MSESNNIKFVEANGKWLWKRYDEQGSVIFRSPEFETERQAREDYEANGGDTQTASSQPEAPVQTQEAGGATDTNTSAPEDSNAAGNVAPEGEISAGNASPDASQPSADQAI